MSAAAMRIVFLARARGLAIVALALCSSAANAQIITTIAGTDFQFPTGPLAAVNAPLGGLSGVAVDIAGDVFIVDPNNARVFEMTPAGALTVVAGNGIFAFSGDGGPAASAALQLGNSGVAVDSAGNVYIADSGNNRIRKVSNGVITTIAGNGSRGFSGDGGRATSASLFAPTGIAVDTAGVLYIADYGNNRIRSVSNGVITTVAGNGSASFSGNGGAATAEGLNQPYGVAVDSAGNLYIADTGDNRVLKVSNGIMTPFAGNGSVGTPGDGGPAVSAEFGHPDAVAVDPAGNVYIADEFIGQIRKVSNGVITTIAGNGAGGFTGDGGSATNASIGYATGVAADATGHVYVADQSNRRIRKVSNGVINTVAGNGNYSFSGDGGPATSATLQNPSGAAADSAGNLYIADTGNRRVRRVSNGVITTVAGNGVAACTGSGGQATSAETYPISITLDSAGNIYIGELACIEVWKISSGVITKVAGGGGGPGNGDGGLATSASLSPPAGVAVDSAGNLYIADQYSARIRKVSNGVITTIAGNGAVGFSGDGGSATSASLNLAYGGGLAIDSSGNLYIADTGNNRIRKVSNGVITTAAGNGSTAFSGDGGPATSASVGGPSSVAVDTAGNLYMNDTYNNRIRKVSNGVITTIAGSGIYGFSGDGGPALSAALNPAAVAVDPAGNIYVVDSYFNRIREILVQPPFSESPLAAGASSLVLTQASGGKPVTATLNADTTTAERSSVAVPGTAYTVQVTSGSSWLSVSPQSGSTPGLITLTADPLNLAQGVYNGTIVISLPLANPSTQTVNVTFTVTAAVPPAISLDHSHLSFTYATTSTARTQTLVVSNSGGGSLNFTTSTELNSGVSANWLSVTPESGTATPGTPVALAVTADPGMLSVGTYTASLTINSGSAGSVTIPITTTITPNPLVMLLSQAGLTFTAVKNGGVIPAQTFGVLNLGSGTLNWSVQRATLPAGGTWLIATPERGSSIAGAPAPTVTVSVNPAALAPGVYYGLITVVSAGAANTPQQITVVLNVVPPGTDIAQIIQPSSLIFTAPAGGSSPSSQLVSVYDPTGTSKSFRSGVVGGFVTLPTDATISPNEPTQIVVQPFVNGLAPGTSNGTLTLQFSDGRVSTVEVSFVVTNASSTTAERPQATTRESGSSVCTPTKLIPVLTTIFPSFNIPAGYPTGLSVNVMDDCGNPQTTGIVTVTFTNGDPPLGLISLNNGTWQGTWYSRAQNTQVKLTVTAVEPEAQLKGTAEVNGGISPTQPPPMITPGGVVSAASPVAYTPVAPGGIIAIYGNVLADSSAPAAALPLPTTLGNANAVIAGQIVPLFYAGPGQINAIVPFGLNTNTTYSVLVRRDQALSSPVSIDIADAQPAAFLSGGNAIVEDYRGTAAPFLVTPASPAQAGDTLVIYCAGLGVTNQTLVDGTASPGNPPAQTQAAVTVSIGGQNATVSFAGLTPSLVGLYQINVVMPAGVPPGNSAPVILTVAGQTSPAAVIATQ